MRSLTSGTNRSLRQGAAGILGNHTLDLTVLRVCICASVLHDVTANIKEIGKMDGKSVAAVRSG